MELWVNYELTLERVSNKKGKIMQRPNVLIAAMSKARLFKFTLSYSWRPFDYKQDLTEIVCHTMERE